MQTDVEDHKAIGHYGNGFKSGSMRLGKDALVLSRNGDCETVGLLSQTFLKAEGKKSVMVPMFSWMLPGREVMGILSS